MKFESNVILVHLIMTKMLSPLIMMVSDGFDIFSPWIVYAKSN
jgi:hypothetical protein